MPVPLRGPPPGSWQCVCPHEPMELVSVVIIGCWCLSVSTAARLGAITTTIVLLVPMNGPVWDIALFRVAEVAIGMACAVPVSWLFSWIEQRWLHT